jgi:hypothetical protein
MHVLYMFFRITQPHTSTSGSFQFFSWIEELNPLLYFFQISYLPSPQDALFSLVERWGGGGASILDRNLSFKTAGSFPCAAEG